MAHSDEDLAAGRLDLVPMIDCVMLLLLFFILTSSFSDPDRIIGNLLPTDQGPGTPSTVVVTPPQRVRIDVYPAWGPDQPMQPGFTESAYAEQFARLNPRTEHPVPFATFRIGDRSLVVAAKDLGDPQDKVTAQTIKAIHALIDEALAPFEQPGRRRDQIPITVHCFSGMSWRFAMIAQDAVRGYEQSRGSTWNGRQEGLLELRAIEFAPPLIRDSSVNERGAELHRIINGR